MYEALPPVVNAADFLAQLNAQGARGFRFLSGFAFTTGPSSFEQVMGYVKDADMTYSYELPPSAADTTAFENQLNAQGARGFEWGGPIGVGGENRTIYRKVAGSASSYSYAVLAGAGTSASFLGQANGQGAGGYYYVTQQGIGGAFVNVYRKDSQGSATYGYEVLANPGGDNDFFAQLNAQGARSYRFKTPYAFGSEGAKVIYEKDLSQAPAFSYYALDDQGSSAAFISQANAEGAKGSGLIGSYALPSGAIKTLYFTSTNCTGFLCDTRMLFGF